jgi:hypothetical protein
LRCDRAAEPGRGSCDERSQAMQIALWGRSHRPSLFAPFSLGDDVERFLNNRAGFVSYCFALCRRRSPEGCDERRRAHWSEMTRAGSRMCGTAPERLETVPTTTNQSHLRPYVGGSASEARFNEETRRPFEEDRGCLAARGHHPFLRLSTNAGNVKGRNNSCRGANSADTAHTSTRDHSASGV